MKCFFGVLSGEKSLQSGVMGIKMSEFQHCEVLIRSFINLSCARELLSL